MDLLEWKEETRRADIVRAEEKTEKSPGMKRATWRELVRCSERDRQTERQTTRNPCNHPSHSRESCKQQPAAAALNCCPALQCWIMFVNFQSTVTNRVLYLVQFGVTSDKWRMRSITPAFCLLHVTFSCSGKKKSTQEICLASFICSEIISLPMYEVCKREERSEKDTEVHTQRRPPYNLSRLNLTTSQLRRNKSSRRISVNGVV